MSARTIGTVATMTEPPEDHAEVVASAGDLDSAVALLREFLHRSGALRVIGVVEGTAGPPAIIDCGQFGPIEIDLGGRLLQIPHGAHLDAPTPDLPEIHQMPVFEVVVETGQVTGAIGGLEHLADAVRSLASLLGDGAIAVASFPTTDPQMPISLSARASGTEPIVVTVGDETFELP